MIDRGPQYSRGGIRRRRVRLHALAATLVAMIGCTSSTSPDSAADRATSGARWPTLDGRAPIVIAHRGASGYRPEHTLESYRLAIEMGADFIEPDLVSTRDGALVARHEPNITATTDVALRPEFAARRRTRVVDGIEEDGWFSVDFTLAELRTLRAIQPRPERSKAFDGRFGIPTLGEIVALAKSESTRLGRVIGIYPETKHPSWHCALGLALEPALLRELAAAGWVTRDAPVFIQSFESGNLQWLRSRTGVRLIQLLDSAGITPDGVALPAREWQPDGRCTLYARGDLPRDVTTGDALAAIARYADGVGPWKRMLIGSRAPTVDAASTPSEPQRTTVSPTRFVELAHATGLAVHPWTFRNESQYLAADYGGDPMLEYAAFLRLGVDGVFSDFPDSARAAVSLAAGSPPQNP
jgi:glycerophosphoryl diester phosphodiesterase